MLIGLLENGLSLQNVADGLAACKKFIPTSGSGTPDAKLQKDLERLALTAPHMLADIGFERDPKACSGEKAVWRCGTHCVIIYSAKQAAAFT